jgi:plasmid stabilization system protein ParE
MSFEIVVRKEAEIDLDEIFVWYEEQKPGLGFDFIHEFENTLTHILRNPNHASCIELDARGASLRRFPYEVIYRTDIEKNQVRVIAIIHQHRSPEWFRQRIHD